jgi:hypothetical protein
MIWRRYAAREASQNWGRLHRLRFVLGFRTFRPRDQGRHSRQGLLDKCLRVILCCAVNLSSLCGLSDLPPRYEIVPAASFTCRPAFKTLDSLSMQKVHVMSVLVRSLQGYVTYSNCDILPYCALQYFYANLFKTSWSKTCHSAGMKLTAFRIHTHYIDSFSHNSCRFWKDLRVTWCPNFF